MAGYVRGSKNWLKHLQKRNEDLRSKKIIEEGLNEGVYLKPEMENTTRRLSTHVLER